jgi:hypothetical protein
MNTTATGLRIGFPQYHPFRTHAQHQADAHIAAPLPPTTVAQSSVAAPQHELFKRLLLNEFFRIQAGRTGYAVELAGDLARVLGHIEGLDSANTGLARE